MMIDLRQKVLAGVTAVLLVSSCAFAQKNDNKRPDKPNDTKVVVKDKDKQQNNNRSNNNKDRRGKPN